MRLPGSLLLLTFLAISCRSIPEDEPGAPDAGVQQGAPDAPLTATGMSIQELLGGGAALESTVTLDPVVVVAHVSDSDDGQVFIQDPGGGAGAGIVLFCDFDSASNMCGMTRDDVDALEIGDVISVTGRYTRAFDRINQITTPTWTKKGTTMAPVATVVSAAMVAKGAEDDAQALSNVYVKIEGPIAISDMGPAQFRYTRCTPPATDAGVPDAGAASEWFRGFEVDAGGATVAVGFKLYDTLDYCLLDCGWCEPADMIVATQTFASISGVVYFERGNSIDFLELRPTKDEDLEID